MKGVFPLIDVLFGFHSLSFAEFGFQVTSRMCNLGQHAQNQTYSDYVTSQYFPRHVICELKIRADAYAIHKYKFQCGLPANVFNEVVFLIIWFWLLILIVFNAFSLLKWTIWILRRRFLIKDILTWPFQENDEVRRYVRSFVDNYLTTEGFLVIMLIRVKYCIPM